MAKMVKLVETKQSGFLLLFLAIILSILANIIWAGQNIDKIIESFFNYGINDFVLIQIMMH